MSYTKKSLGQNFLVDKNIIKKIINLVNIKDKNVIEIGPGEGALTDEILKRKPRTLKAVEKDSYLAKNLKDKYSKIKNVKIFHEDILRSRLEKLILKNTIIMGNLPYNISSQIFVKILKTKKWPSKINDIIFMFQKELGEKIICKYPSNSYGRLSILKDFRLHVINKFLVSPNCFFPKPKVISIVAHFKPKIQMLYKIKKLENLEKVTNILFSNRRKMINKNIKKLLSPKKIIQIKDLNLNLRPSEIKPQIYYKITELFEK